MGPLDSLQLPLALAAVMLIYFLYRRSARGGPALQQPEHDPRAPLLQHAFDRSPHAIGFLDGEGHWIEINRRFTTVLGYTKNELTSVPLRLMTHLEDRKREAQLFAELCGGKRGGYSITKRLLRKTGEFRSFRVAMLRCSDAPHPLFQCTIDDGPQQMTRLEVIADAMRDLSDAAVILCDTTGVVTGWNDAAEELYGYREGEIVGRPWSLLHDEASRPVLSRLFAKAAQSGYVRTTSTRRRADSSQVTVRSIVIPDLRLHDSAGFLEICHPVEADGRLLRESNHESVRLRALTEDNAKLRHQLELVIQRAQHLVQVSAENEQLRVEIAHRAEREAQLNGEIASLKSARAEELPDIEIDLDEEIELPMPSTLAPLSAASFIGRAGTKVRTYHLLECSSARAIPQAQRVPLRSTEEAERQNFKACGRCVPNVAPSIRRDFDAQLTSQNSTSR